MLWTHICYVYEPLRDNSISETFTDFASRGNVKKNDKKHLQKSKVFPDILFIYFIFIIHS